MDDKEPPLFLSEDDAEIVEPLYLLLLERQMFDPPFRRVSIAGRPLSLIPDSDIKYKSFMEWWFAVGQKDHRVTTIGWAVVCGPNVMKGRTEMIPKEDWESLPESEREAIRIWAAAIRECMFYD